MHQGTVYWVSATFWTIRTGTIPASRFFPVKTGVNLMSGKNRFLPAETQPWSEWRLLNIWDSSRNRRSTAISRRKWRHTSGCQRQARRSWAQRFGHCKRSVHWHLMRRRRRWCREWFAVHLGQEALRQASHSTQTVSEWVSSFLTAHQHIRKEDIV